MQTVTLSEFCRIVKKVSEENKGKLSLSIMGENHGTCVDTGIQHGRIPRYMGSGMYKKLYDKVYRDDVIYEACSQVLIPRIIWK